MVETFYDKDADTGILEGKKITIIGYGSQGHAHALNLRDSGFDVIVCSLRDDFWEFAERDGFKPTSFEEGAKMGDVIMMLIPDEHQPDVYHKFVEPALESGKYLGFAHGFNIHFGQIVPPSYVNVFMVAPKGPGKLVREEFVRGRGVPALVAVHQDPSGDTLKIALAYAKGIGATRAGVLKTTFKDETETDLFGEQVVLCGGITCLMRAAFETLVEAGYPEELAYFECIHEMKLIVDLIYRGGFSMMRKFVSNTAKYGDLTRGPRVIDESVKKRMREILDEVRTSRFAREWILENRIGRPVFNALLKEWEVHLAEEVGRRLRKMMPWLEES